MQVCPHRTLLLAELLFTLSQHVAAATSVTSSSFRVSLGTSPVAELVAFRNLGQYKNLLASYHEDSVLDWAVS